MRRRISSFALLSLVLGVLSLGQTASSPERWTSEKANAWYAKQPWLVGSNYIPSDASNELEMWQAQSFHPELIDTELGWAESLGMNTMRVFLHDLLWQADQTGFTECLDKFLQISSKHKIKPILVLFDSCWDPDPKLGPQSPPRPGIHNSRWLQSPGASALTDPSQYPRLEAYVKGVVGAFAQDDRILAWDVWNEPDNTNDSSYGTQEPRNKVALVATLLPQAFSWARAANPQQPLTSGVWHGDWSDLTKLDSMAQEQIALSDVISFHNYGVPNDFAKRVKWLQPLGRPLLCTEYMARGENSTFQGILPLAKQDKIAAINWGFVQGKTQTYLPWDSWQKPYVYRSPTVWFHDIFRTNGQPYRPAEVAFIRKMTGMSTQ